MGILATLSGVRASTGSPSSITLPFLGLTGADCLLVVKGTSSNDMDAGTLTATWQGNPVPVIIGGQNGELQAQIFVLVLGDLEDEDGDVVLSKTMNSDTAMGCEATVYEDFQQGTTVRDTASAAPAALLRTIEVTLAGLTVGDVCVSAAIIPDSGRDIEPEQPAVVVWDPLGGGGVDNASGGTSSIIATGATRVMGWEWSIPRSRVMAAIALIPTQPLKPTPVTFVGTLLRPRVIAGPVFLDPGLPASAGVVSPGAMPVPGPVSVTDSAPALASVVPGPTFELAVIPLFGGVPSFAGTSPSPQLDLAMFQAPVDFAGAVSVPDVTPGALSLEQATLTRVGIVPSDHGFTVGASPDIGQAPNPFAGTVPTQDLIHIVEHLGTPFVGAVLAPSVEPGRAPFVRQTPIVEFEPEAGSIDDNLREFVGAVGAPNVTMGLEQVPSGFAGHVPRPFSVILRSADGRKIISLGLGA